MSIPKEIKYYSTYNTSFNDLKLIWFEVSSIPRKKTPSNIPNR